MDADLVQEPKKTTFRRANAAQLKVLKAAFAASNVTAKHSLAALSEATGLAQRWISSWFTRERKKNATAAARRAVKVKTTATSMEEITAFKMENHDPALPLATHAHLELETEQKPIVSTHSTNKTARKPRKKLNSAAHLASSTTSNAAPSPLRSPFVSVPLASRVLSLAAAPLAQEALKPVDMSSSSSVYMAPSSGLASSLKSAAIANLSISVPDDDYNSNARHDITDEPQLDGVGWPSIVSPSTVSTGRITVTHDSHRSALRPTEPSASKHVIQTQIQDRNRNHPRPPRPLLPLYTSPSAHFADSESLNPFQLLQTLYAPPLHWSTQTPDGRSTKENKAPPSYSIPPMTRAQPPAHKGSAPALKPLFSYENLSMASTTVRQQQTQCTSYPPPLQYPAHSYAQPQVQPQQYPPPQRPQDASSAAPAVTDDSSYDQDNALDHSRSLQDPHATVLDPTASALKHLNIVPLVTSENLLADDMVRRLLDERLAQEDPFQAAMGLVLVSRMGMTWDMS